MGLGVKGSYRRHRHRRRRRHDDLTLLDTDDAAIIRFSSPPSPPPSTPLFAVSPSVLGFALATSVLVPDVSTCAFGETRLSYSPARPRPGLYRLGLQRSNLMTSLPISAPSPLRFHYAAFTLVSYVRDRIPTRSLTVLEWTCRCRVDWGRD